MFDLEDIKFSNEITGINPVKKFEFGNSGLIKNNIKPIIGLDVIINDYHIYLYAKNYKGYQNLLKMNTLIQNNITLDDLNKYNSDLLCIIPYQSLDIYNDLKKIYNDLFIGYKTELEKKDAMIKSNHVVYVNDTRALEKSDLEYLSYLKLIDENEIEEYKEKKSKSSSLFKKLSRILIVPSL